MISTLPKGEIILYKTEDGRTSLKVKVEKDTIWLTQKQIASLFGTQRPAITKHLNNIFLSKELEERSVCSKMERTASDGKRYQTKYYNLDAIISVGYRVNSTKATQFRTWATNTLKQHILKGYTIHKAQLQKKSLEELEQTIGLVKKSLLAKKLSHEEERGLLDIITEYSQTWILLQKFDQEALPEPKTIKARATYDYEFAVRGIGKLKANLLQKQEASELFGRESENCF